MGRLSRLTRSLPLMAAAVMLVMFAVVGAGIALSLRTAGTLETLHTLTADADRVSDVGEELLIGLLDAESNARAYLLTRRATYLVPYTTARVGAVASLAELDDAAARLASLAGETQAIRTLAMARLTLLAAAVQAANAGAENAVQPLIASDTGAVTMRQARSLIERLVQHAAEERDRRSAGERQREQAIRISVTLAGVAGVMLLGTAALGLLSGRTRLLRAQRALQSQSALWQATVENLQDAVAVFDSAGGLVQWNRNLVPLTGLPDALLVHGTPFARFVQAAGHWQPPVLTAASPGGSVAYGPAIEVRAADRVLMVSVNAMPGGGHMVVVADITRRADAEAIARQAQKMEVLGQLTGGVAHDFNNLLQVVSANLELMAARIEAIDPLPRDWLASRLAAALEGVSRGALLTRHLLAFARRQPLAPGPVDAGQLLTGLDDMLRRTLGPLVALEPIIAPGLWALQADAQQLENAILNLAINGRDSMAGIPPDQARLVIEARNAALEEAYCAANPEVVPGPYVMIAVTDFGCGMTPGQIARAIEPFYTTKPEGQGTGLGLSMVYGFAKQSGGHLKLYSEPGHGTTAKLYIPRTTAAAAVASAEAPSSRPTFGQGEMVLLVEDDPAVRAAASLALRGLGYRVEEAVNADAGMAMLAAGLRPDLLFTDVMMPGTLTAREMATRAQTLHPGLAVVFTSGYTESAAIHNGKLDPAMHLISKPWRLEDLASRLRQALQQSRPSRRARLRILLVEDDELVRMVTADMLAELGHDVVEAADAEDALRQLDGVGLLITDIGLGQTDGFALVGAARGRHPDLPVIVASGRPRPPTGAAGLIWLHKPYDNTALKAALDTVLSNRIHASA